MFKCRGLFGKCQVKKIIHFSFRKMFDVELVPESIVRLEQLFLVGNFLVLIKHKKGICLTMTIQQKKKNIFEGFSVIASDCMLALI